MPGLVIFDCDGVLVDSEPIAIAVLTDFLRDLDLPVDETFAYRHFLGRSWPTVAKIVDRTFGRRIGPADEDRLRQTLFDRFRSDLRPMPGVVEALAGLSLPSCVASSSVPQRLRLSLSLTGLLRRFEPNVFSASEVAHGKPAPDLFFHAAASMGFAASDCLVVEDSPIGIEAARNAGMRVAAFLGGGHVAASGTAEAVLSAGPHAVFHEMSQLSAVLSALG